MVDKEIDIVKTPGSVSSEEYEKVLLENKKLGQDLELLQFQFNQLQRMLFGVKSERFVPKDDALLTLPFQEEELAITEEEEIQNEKISYERKVPQKKKPVRSLIPAHLPRVEEVIEPPIEEGAIKIGEEITEVMEYTPASIYVRKIIRPKYASKDHSSIHIAELPSLPIPKGNAGASLLAHIMVSKFIDHLPFYRQRQIFKRSGLILSDSTFNGWFKATANVLTLLYDELEKQVLSSSYIQADESPIGVQDSHKKHSLHRGFQWVYRAPIEGLVLFKYDASRSTKAADKVLHQFHGTLQTDGYKVYQNLKNRANIKSLACMAHARRYFDKAKSNDHQRSTYILSQIQMLYAIERNAQERNVSFQTRKRYRQLYAKPILLNMETWLKNNASQTLPQSPIGKAIAYTLNLWDSLKSYIDDGKYEIDNNQIENSIRPLALGRKNYLFAGSHDAAQNIAMMYSFFATCKACEVNPFEWLTDVLNRIQQHKGNKLYQLLPKNWKTQHPQD